MGILKNIWRRFRGGPDFSQCAEITAILEDTQLTLTLPISNIQTFEPPRLVNFPYLQPGWFESNLAHQRQHNYVHIITELWYYMPNGLSAMFSELGLFSLAVRLKRIPESKDVNAKELEALGKHLIREYDEFYNSPVFCDQNGYFPDGSKCEVDGFIGLNTKRKWTVEKEIRDAWGKELTEAELQEKIKDRAPLLDYPPLDPHQIKSISGRDWVFYTEQMRNSVSKQHNYCFPLNSNYYLSLRFKYRVDISTKFKLWREHAEEAEQKIMQMVKIEDYQPSETSETESDNNRLLCN